MKNGIPFEVSKEVYERAQKRGGYMADEDIKELFDISIRCGYGLYSCRVHEDNGKYICTYSTGSTCD